MASKGYTIDDLIFYTGLFAGIIIFFVATEQFEIHRIIRLLIGGLIGSGLGWLALKAYHKMTIPEAPRDEERPDRMI